MLKNILLLSFLIAITFASTIFGNFLSQNERNNNQLNLGDQPEKGASITPQIQAKIKTIIEQAYVFNGNTTLKNSIYIYQQMKTLYSGDWVVGIYGSAGNGTQAQKGKNFGVSSASTGTGGEWWIYWKGANHYQPKQAYYISRQQTNSSYMMCFCQANTTFTDTVFQNVVNAVEMDYASDMQGYSENVQNYLHEFSGKYTTVSVVNSTAIQFSLCSSSRDSQFNLIQKANQTGFTVFSTDRNE